MPDDAIANITIGVQLQVLSFTNSLQCNKNSNIIKITFKRCGVGSGWAVLY